MSGLLIAGFHRSGTSSLAQHLARSGLHLGDELIGAAPSNPYGHFEDADALRLHDGFLAALGQDWACADPEPPDLSAEERTAIAAYASARAHRADPWGVKDPRLCRFIAGWGAALSGTPAVIVYRAPDRACRSLIRREVGLLVSGEGDAVISRRFIDDPDHALRLWLSHNASLAAFAEAHPDQVLVSGHAGFLAGRNIAAELAMRFGLHLKPAPPEETLDPAALSGGEAMLSVTDKSLRDAVLETWARLHALDTSPAEADRPDPARLNLDTTGEAARSAIAALCQQAEAAHQAALAVGEVQPQKPNRKSRNPIKRLGRFLARRLGR